MRAVSGCARYLTVSSNNRYGALTVFFSVCATCVVILATKSLILFSSFECLASKPARVPIPSPFIGFYESHTLLTCFIRDSEQTV